MTNAYYNHTTGEPVTSSRASSSAIRAELDAIQAGFALVETAVAAIHSAVGVFTKNQSVTPVALTSSAGSVAVDASLSNSFTYTETENTTVAFPTNLTNGMWLHFLFKGSSLYTTSFNASYQFATNSPVTTLSLNEVARMTAYYDSVSNKCYCIWEEIA